jgi:hypothetical protein
MTTAGRSAPSAAFFITATALFSNCGEDLRPQVEKIVEDWSGLDRRGLTFLPGPGNRVRLRYSELVREREEYLESVVPALDPASLLNALPELDFLFLVFNSGFDIALSDWRSIADRAPCPVWIDIHSLALAARIGAHRDYRALPDWPSWVRGASYLQANRQEVACMMGHPERWADEGEIRAMAGLSFGLGQRAVFITLGKDGVLVATPEDFQRVPAPAAAAVVDTTGCGDVFAAATARALIDGNSPVRAAEYGVKLATRAAGISGLRETYNLAFRARLEYSR